MFYEAIDRTPGLNLDELRVLIVANRCFPEDVLFLRKYLYTRSPSSQLISAGNWLVSNRKAYLAMQECIAQMNNVHCEHLKRSLGIYLLNPRTNS
jgi:hypothetical protein